MVREDVVIIHRSPHRAQCTERALVLRAVFIPHAVRFRDGEWFLLVPQHQARNAAHQLDEYVRENRDWPRQRVSIPHHAVDLRGVAAYVVVLLVVAAVDGDRAFGFDWFGAGRVQTQMIRDGEWWRTVTALTLHLDIGHLAGNLGLGALFGLLAGQLLGNGLAWFCILLGGAVGNALSAIVQAPEHKAVGASTAVFAALGLLGAYVWRRRRDLKGRWAMRWAPIVGAVVLLAFMGSGGERTDVFAHLAGFLAGIAMGTYCGGFGPGVVLGRRSQWALGVSTLVLLVTAWAIALATHG